MSNEELETAALSLPVELRAELAHRLIASLDDEATDAIDAAWIREVDKRADEVLNGKAKLIPGDEVFRKAHARLRKS